MYQKCLCLTLWFLKKRIQDISKKPNKNQQNLFWVLTKSNSVKEFVKNFTKPGLNPIKLIL
ncbi:hypothetical protein LEP1GSC073_2397 [Leptospira noguchii str. Cascata]|nr:hypothetical protein LEP1GSC073_2397 [Leptospira noguchii str. Cascata]